VSLSHLPTLLSAWFETLAGALHKGSATRLPLLLLGILFAKGRRTVTAWFRAAGITLDFRHTYHVVWAVGRRAPHLAARLLVAVVRPLMDATPGQRLVFALDDTPTKRFGPCIQGAGIHHNPTPGPAGERFCYGHVWVSLAWLAPHRLWGIVALPLQALLYVRAKDVPTLNAQSPKAHWQFHTKLQLAVQLIDWLLCWLHNTGRSIWLVIDGGYANGQLLKPMKQRGVTVVGRLRKDADLRSLPPTRRRRGRRGPMPTYGRQRYDLAKRAGQQRGWNEVPCTQYGCQVVKTVKVFEATWRPAGGAILVVLIREDDGWLAFFCTDVGADVKSVLEAVANRNALEQTFKAVKEVWGGQQQQVRNLYACIGAWNLNLGLFTMVEVWAWDRPEGELVDRSASPWDFEPRRASHADKRKALQREVLREEIEGVLRSGPTPRDYRELAERLLGMAA
jgi:hypothetical protein